MAGCGGSDSAKTFTVGFDAEYPPYGYRTESGDYAGFDLDLAAEVCERNGWELVKQPIDWDAKDMELNSGAIDCIWNGFTMTGREDEYTFSKPYVDNSIVYVVRADSDIQTEADLAGKHVITQAGSSALSALQDESKADVVNSFASLDEIADYNTAFMNLEAGTNDAIAVDIGVAQYQLTTKADKFRMLEEPLSTEQYAIGFKKGNEELRDRYRQHWMKWQRTVLWRKSQQSIRITIWIRCFAWENKKETVMKKAGKDGGKAPAAFPAF